MDDLSQLYDDEYLEKLERELMALKALRGRGGKPKSRVGEEDLPVLGSVKKARQEQMIKDLESIPALKGKSNEISKRIPLIIRYNVLSMETCPELLSHPGPTGHTGLTGVGLYFWPSFFNHDSRPNACRYSVGDIMWFVANQNIARL